MMIFTRKVGRVGIGWQGQSLSESLQTVRGWCVVKLWESSGNCSGNPKTEFLDLGWDLWHFVILCISVTDKYPFFKRLWCLKFLSLWHYLICIRNCLSSRTIEEKFTYILSYINSWQSLVWINEFLSIYTIILLFTVFYISVIRYVLCSKST
jgi:hypothetical protein